MIRQEYEKLQQAAQNGERTSIAINADGTPVRGSFIPWEKTPSAFNMRTPKITLAAADLKDKEIAEALQKCVLIGCYIFVPLDDYNFLAEFGRLEDLFICHGQNIRDLNFVRNLEDLFMFYLEEADLPDLKPLITVFNRHKGLPAKNMAFYKCAVKDTSSIQEIACMIMEFLVWPVAGDEKKHWEPQNKIRGFKYYEK